MSFSKTIRITVGLKKSGEIINVKLTTKLTCKLTNVGYRTALKYLSRDPEYLKARAEARLKNAVR